MEAIDQVSAAEMERMMKVQEVILRAMAGSLKWWEAAEIIGVTDRTMRRWRERYQEHGYDGLHDRRKGRASPKRIAVALQGAELIPKRTRRGSHRRRRPQRPLPGMMLHMDGSKHAWFQDGRRHDLLVILDDATSEIYYAQLVEEESRLLRDLRGPLPSALDDPDLATASLTLA